MTVGQIVLQVTLRNTYGQERIYPMNEAAMLAADLVGAKTLQLSHLVTFSQLGLAIEYVGTPVTASDMGRKLLGVVKQSRAA